MGIGRDLEASAQEQQREFTERVARHALRKPAAQVADDLVVGLGWRDASKASPRAIEIAAQVWCEDSTKHKVMDRELCEAFAKTLDRYLPTGVAEQQDASCDCNADCAGSTGLPPMNFAAELTVLANRYSEENRSDTPDFILARFMVRALDAFNETVNARERWYGREGVNVGNPLDHVVSPPQGDCCTDPPPSTPYPHTPVLKRPSCDPSMEFKPLTDEKYREYLFSDENGQLVIRIDEPQALHISASGTHRVIARSGVCTIVSPGWKAIQFETNTDYGFAF